MRVVMIGATGLVGALLADQLLERGHEVHGLARRPSGRAGPGWHEQIAPALDWPDRVAPIHADAAISCLGTTRRQAGSEAAFRAIDFDAVVAFARAAKAAGVRHFLAVSSVGADPGSRNFYLRTKGETEAALEALAFERLDLFRPGLLLGDRTGGPRLGERVATLLDPLTRIVLRGRLGRFAGIPAGTVADAIAAAVESSKSGVYVHENRAIHSLAVGVK